MYRKERLEQIMEILRKNGYVTVAFLTEELHYSTATVNRDLNTLEQMKLVKRSYGGAEAAEHRAMPLPFRYEQMKPLKKKICKRAAEFVEDGDSIFIDGSTTAQYIGQYLTEKKDLRVTTNNMALAMYLSEEGINVSLLGGTIAEAPYMTDGADAQLVLLHKTFDKCFFSSYSMTEDGKICSGENYFLLHILMLEHSGKSYYLADSEKRREASGRVLCDFSGVTAVISDMEFDDALRKDYPDTEFVTVAP